MCRVTCNPWYISLPKISWNFLYYFQEYSYSTANMFTAVICALFFPDKFNITVFILFSMLFLFAGIYCYEKKNLHIQFPDSNSCPSAKEKGVKWPLHLFILFFFIFHNKIKTHPSFLHKSEQLTRTSQFFLENHRIIIDNEGFTKFIFGPTAISNIKSITIFWEFLEKFCNFF